MSKVIKAVFTGRFCTTRRVFQWDTDDKLQFVNLDLPQNYTVDFANSLTGQSVPVLATSDTVQIPPDMFVPGSEIYAWVWISDTNGGHTRCQATIPIDPRAQRSGTSPAPAQASAWDEAVGTLNETVEGIPAAINTALAEAKASGEFDGENGNIIWWTSDRPVASGDNAAVQRRKLHGPDGLTPAVGDYVFGPAVGAEGEPTTLYVIISSTTAVIMTALGRIVGSDGYSPEVTITEITGGHRVTITDSDHPDGQSFDVMDGQGGSGSSDYDDLTNKPQINSVALTGNKSLSDLGIEPEAFVVTITNSGGSYSADKTYAQITAAASAGKRVVATIDDVYFSYYGLSNGADALFYNTKQLTNSFWSISSSNVLTHYTSVAGNYSKPASGIPKTDLASAVQTSLGKADTAYQKPSGGIPATDLASGVIPTVPSASSATPQALGTAAAGSSTDYSRADHVHAKPTYTKSDVGLGNVDNVQQYSATNPPPYPVSSVNGQTGAVTLSIPSTAADVGAAPAVTEVTVSTAGDVTQALDPGKIYHFTGAISSLTLTLTAAGTGQLAQYHFDFNSGSTAATVSITGVTWQGGNFTPSASKHYEVDILNGYGVVCEW